jgi:hypothetical protein
MATKNAKKNGENKEERKRLYRKEEDRKGNGTKKERSKSVGKKSIIHQEEEKFRKGVGKSRKEI